MGSNKETVLNSKPTLRATREASFDMKRGMSSEGDISKTRGDTSSDILIN